MWKTLVIDTETHFMKYVKEENSHTVYLTDVAHLWMEQLTSLEVSQRCKEMNALIEAEPEDLAKHVYTLITESDPSTTGISRKLDGEICKVRIESQLAGIPFLFTFRMVQLHAEKVCEEVTFPILLLAVQQQCQLSQLHDLLKKKDREIEQYKLEGAVLKKRKLETEPFCEESIKMNIDRNIMGDKTTHIDLFAELCPYMFVVPKIIPFRKESSSHEAEVKKLPSETETNSGPPSEHIVSEPECQKDEVNAGSISETIKEEKSPVKPKLSQTKKPKLRI